MDVRERAAILDAALPQFLTHESRIETRTETTAVLVHGKPVNHLLHFLVSVLTCGVWAVWWVVYAVMGGERREMVSVDETGQISRRKFGA